MKTFLKTSVFLVSLAAFASQDAKVYQYWFDKVTPIDNQVVTSPLQFEADVSAMQPGGHILKYRLQDEDKQWGAPYFEYFYIPVPSRPQVSISGYEYWLDKDRNLTVGGELNENDTPNFDLDVANLQPGGHILNYRLRDNSNRWGTLMAKPFYVPLNDIPTNDVKKKYQYWLDNDLSSLVEGVYTEELKDFDIDVKSLSEGGHTLTYRLLSDKDRWGVGMIKPFYVPVSQDESSSNAIAYRVLFNGKILSTQPIPIESGKASIEIEETIPDDVVLGNVFKRTFTYVEDEVRMQADGNYTYAIQMLSDKNEWGSPFYIEADHSVNAKVVPAVMDVPADFSSNKVDNNHFHAVKLINSQYPLYIKPSQDCYMDFYSITGSESMSSIASVRLNKDETTFVESLNKFSEVIAVVYNMPIDERNTDQDIFIRFMYEDNKVPKPVISFDSNTWNVNITCAEKRATIFYTLNGEKPDRSSEIFTSPIHIDRISTVRAFAVLEGFEDSDESVLNIDNVKLPKPEIKYISDNLFSLTNAVEGVTIYYTLDGSSPENERTRLTFDGTPFAVESSCRVRAYAEKANLLSSDMIDVVINLNDYVTSSPYRNEYDGSKMSFIVPEGKAYYRTFIGKDESVAGVWSEYKGGYVDITGNMTVQIFSEVEGKSPSSIVSYYTDWVPAAEPTFECNGFNLILKSSTPGSKIYYYLYGQNEEDAVEYNAFDMLEGIDISNAISVYAYAEAEGYSRSSLSTFFKEAYALSKPALSYANGYVIADHDDSEVSIYFTDEDGNHYDADEEDQFRIKAPYNSIVNAYASKSGFINSEVVTIYPTEAPKIIVDLFTVSIDSKPGQVVTYTTDGSTPTESSNIYSGQFTGSESCEVRAVAFGGEYVIPAEAKSVKIGYQKVETPSLNSYDGRYLSVSSEEGSTLIYLIGKDEASFNDEGKEVIGNKIDVEGLNTIKVKARRSGADDSDVFTYEVKYYANDNHVYTAESGHIKDVFNWCEDLADIESLSVHGTLYNSLTSDKGDYLALMSLPKLRHIDLSDIYDEIIPDSALVSDNLVSVVLPQTMKSVGKLLFGENNSSLCALEISGDQFVPSNLLDGVNNPNLLIYTKSKNYVTALLDANANKKINLVILGSINSPNKSDNIDLIHGYPFFVPKAFTAQKISYIRSFTKETQIDGVGSGWETMVVPFDVQSVSCAGKVLKPFGEAETEKGDCPFWLFKGGDIDWEKVSYLEANTPYMLAIPNNPLYADEFNVNGDVIFSSNSVFISTTPTISEMTDGFGLGKDIVGNYDFINKDENVYALNSEDYSYKNFTYKPGGIFVKGQRDVLPFECYVTSASPSLTRAIPVFDSSDVESLIGDDVTKIWSERYEICIRSSIALKLRIYDTVGNLIRNVSVKAGETVRVQDITPGIYFVGTTKILVKG